MEKTRVPAGEKYWSIDKYGSIQEYLECGSVLNDYHYESLIYFYTEEEARVMRDKLRAVLNGAWVLTPPEGESFSRKVEAILNGADAIEMPSEEEIIQYEPVEDLRFRNGWMSCYNWLKSKIVK